MKRAPQVWGELDATGQEFFHMYMEKTWPLFRCAEGEWKLDRIACMCYPAWRANHINAKGNWLTKEERKKRKIKSKTKGEGPSHSKKQKGKVSSKLQHSINDFLHSDLCVYDPHLNQLATHWSILSKLNKLSFQHHAKLIQVCIFSRPRTSLCFYHVS